MYFILYIIVDKYYYLFSADFGCDLYVFKIELKMFQAEFTNFEWNKQPNVI